MSFALISFAQMLHYVLSTLQYGTLREDMHCMESNHRLLNYSFEVYESNFPKRNNFIQMLGGHDDVNKDVGRWNVNDDDWHDLHFFVKIT